MGVVIAECSDSDSGKNKYEFGGVTSNGETFQDKCDGENIQEYFCSVDNIASYTLLPCIDGCEDGVCTVANNAPKALAPNQDSNNSKLQYYFYGFIVLLILAMYVYWFKLRKKRR